MQRCVHRKKVTKLSSRFLVQDYFGEKTWNNLGIKM